jgi:hypothetical protein
MEEISFINSEKLPQMALKLQGSELKLLLLVLFYLSSNNKHSVHNDEKWREYMSTFNFDLTPEATCSLFSRLTKKTILKRISRGEYTIDDSLYLPSKRGEKSF